MSALIECVPNFSEGKDKIVLSKIESSIRSVPEVRLLNVDPGMAANRTVFTFVGPPKAVIEAAYQSIKTASSEIDMSIQKGTHPRMGATDVCPFIPIKGITIKELIPLIDDFAKKVGNELHIPVYLYEASAKKNERKNLAYIRSGEYEGFPKKMQLPDWKPDYGPSEFNFKTGATAIGVRNFLIAYNVNLNTKSVDVANTIAKQIRESGYLKKDEKGNKVRVPGKFKSVKAIGWFIEDFDCAQVSMNLTNFKETPIHLVFEEIKRLARELGTEVIGSELVGLIPEEALIESGKFYAQSTSLDKTQLIELAIQNLGLNSVKSFKPEKQVLEYLVG